MWKKCGNIWVCIKMPIITIEPVGKGMWQACCGGRPVPLIPTSYNLEYVMSRTESYYDARIEMEAVKERWL